MVFCQALERSAPQELEVALSSPSVEGYVAYLESHRLPTIQVGTLSQGAKKDGDGSRKVPVYNGPLLPPTKAQPRFMRSICSFRSRTG